MNARLRGLWRPAVALLLVVLFWGAVFGPSFLGHCRVAADPRWITDDALLHVWPFLRYHAPEYAQPDYIADYLLSCYPVGYKGLYAGLAQVWDPRAFTRIVPFVLLAILLVSLGAAVRPLAGWVGVAAVGAFVFSDDDFLGRLVGGLPRAYAFPFLAVMAAALVHGRVRLMIAATLIGAMFYPILPIVGGLALAALLLVMPAEDRGQARAWSLRKRVLCLAGTALGIGLVSAPMVAANRPFGPLLELSDQTAYPEAGFGGRRGKNVSANYAAPLPAAIGEFGIGSLRGRGRPFCPALNHAMHEAHRSGAFPSSFFWVAAAIAFVAVGGGVIQAWRDARARRLLALVFGSFAAYLLARALSPHLLQPAKYVKYTVPILTVLFVVIGSAALPALVKTLIGSRRAAWDGPVARGLALALVCGGTLLAFGGRVYARTGFSEQMSDRHGWMAFVSTLPPECLIAGWPDDMDEVPYFSGRRVLVSRETHEPYHRAYLDEMRHRMYLLLRAYFARDAKPLFDLREGRGVTHLVIDRKQFREGHHPRYFLPFDGWIDKLHAKAKPGDFEVWRRQTNAVFDSERYYVLDLRTLRAE